MTSVNRCNRFAILFCISFLLQAQDPPKRVFVQGEITVTVVVDPDAPAWLPRFFPLLHPGGASGADTAIIEIFYRYESTAFKDANGKPAKLLLSATSICPVFGSADVGCEVAARAGITLDSIEFVRVKFLKTVKEVDHIKQAAP
jgi:hypothetical protein